MKSIKNIRKEFKNQGVFYTSDKLTKTLLKYVDKKPTSVYDPTCGCGQLLKMFDDDVKKYGQELDGEQLKLCEQIPNFTGYAGDTLLDDKFKGVKFDCIMANPPFSIKWQSDLLQDDERFKECGILPPPSKADWAFMLHILNHLEDNGIAVILEFPGILYRGAREGKIRQWFVENNYIDRVVAVPPNKFEDTSIRTAIIVLKKNKNNTNIIFEDMEDDRSVVVDYAQVEKEDFNLSVSAYLPKEVIKEEINIDEVNKQIADCVIKRVRAMLDMEALEEIFGDMGISYFKEKLKQLLKEK